MLSSHHSLIITILLFISSLLCLNTLHITADDDTIPITYLRSTREGTTSTILLQNSSTSFYHYTASAQTTIQFLTGQIISLTTIPNDNNVNSAFSWTDGTAIYAQREHAVADVNHDYSIPEIQTKYLQRIVSKSQSLQQFIFDGQTSIVLSTYHPSTRTHYWIEKRTRGKNYDNSIPLFSKQQNQPIKLIHDFINVTAPYTSIDPNFLFLRPTVNGNLIVEVSVQRPWIEGGSNNCSVYHINTQQTSNNQAANKLLQYDCKSGETAVATTLTSDSLVLFIAPVVAGPIHQLTFDSNLQLINDTMLSNIVPNDWPREDSYVSMTYHKTVNSERFLFYIRGARVYRYKFGDSTSFQLMDGTKVSTDYRTNFVFTDVIVGVGDRLYFASTRIDVPYSGSPTQTSMITSLINNVTSTASQYRALSFTVEHRPFESALSWSSSGQVDSCYLFFSDSVNIWEQFGSLVSIDDSQWLTQRQLRLAGGVVSAFQYHQSTSTLYFFLTQTTVSCLMKYQSSADSAPVSFFCNNGTTPDRVRSDAENNLLFFIATGKSVIATSDQQGQNYHINTLNDEHGNPLQVCSCELDVENRHIYVYAAIHWPYAQYGGVAIYCYDYNTTGEILQSSLTIIAHQKNDYNHKIMDAMSHGPMMLHLESQTIYAMVSTTSANGYPQMINATMKSQHVNGTTPQPGIVWKQSAAQNEIRCVDLLAFSVHINETSISSYFECQQFVNPPTLSMTCNS